MQGYRADATRFVVVFVLFDLFFLFSFSEGGLGFERPIFWGLGFEHLNFVGVGFERLKCLG